MSKFLLGFLWTTWLIEGWIKPTPKHKAILFLKVFLKVYKIFYFLKYLLDFIFTEKQTTIILHSPFFNALIKLTWGKGIVHSLEELRWSC